MADMSLVGLFIERREGFREWALRKLGINPYFGLQEVLSTVEEAKDKVPEDHLQTLTLGARMSAVNTGITDVVDVERVAVIEGLEEMIIDHRETADYSIDRLDDSIVTQRRLIEAAQQRIKDAEASKVEVRQNCDEGVKECQEVIAACNKAADLALGIAS